MPCMNFTSAGVAPIFERSRACSAPTTLLASPGAPGWTMAGADRPDVPVVRHAAASAAGAAANRHAATRHDNLVILCDPPPVTLTDRRPLRNWPAERARGSFPPFDLTAGARLVEPPSA